MGKRERASPLGRGGDRRLGELETLPNTARNTQTQRHGCALSREPGHCRSCFKEREVNFQTPIWSSEIRPSVVQPAARTGATWGDQPNRRHRQNFKK